MSTIKIKTSHTVETEHEIQIPSYYKSSCFTWKVLSEKRAICVFTSASDLDGSIEITSASHIFNPNLKCEPCTQEEFDLKYLEAVQKLSNLAENGIVIEKQIETI